MADNLPMIPSKNTECKDVRPVLRRVFRELDFLPPLATEGATQRNAGERGDHSLPHSDCWLQQYKAECKEISNHEDDIKNQFAQRIAKQPLPNIFKLHHTEGVKEVPKWKLERGLIDRKDLMPNIEQDAGRAGSLWMRNILSDDSSHDVRDDHASTACVPSPADLSPLGDATVASYSIGKARARPPPPPPSTPPTLVQPQHIVCIPSQLEFVNCAVGHVHTKCLRLFNVSKVECRLSISPTKRRELDVEISSYRGLVATPGAAVKLKVHFRPTDVRAVKDAVAIRVSCGQTFVVPINCFMQPPVLRISVPSTNSSTHLSGSKSSSSASRHEPDVIDLGARLLGDVHCSRLVLQCDRRRATFFMLAEDAWDTWEVNCAAGLSSVAAGPFVWRPRAWRGGGALPARVWCRAPRVGLHVAGVRVLSHVAVTRPLQLVADALHYHRDHLVIQAHEKDYDICSEDDPDCEYYVNLGTGFPRRALSATVLLVNKSPILYNYHWRRRPWGVCHCWDERRQLSTSSLQSSGSDQLCIGAAEARRVSRENPDAYKKREETCHLVQVKPERGHILARSTSSVEVSVPDGGGHVGVQRAVLMLVLENIPKESFPEGYEPMIISTRTAESTPVPGIQSCTREVCEVMVAQMEVWWEIVPLQFVIDPPVLSLYHSRRVKSTEVSLRSWQLYGLDESRVSWVVPEGVSSPPPHLLSTTRCASTSITVPLPSLPTPYPETDLLTLVAANGEWRATCRLSRQCAPRVPWLRPASALLGARPPGARLHAALQLHNRTRQHIDYWCEAYRWVGENEPGPPCVGRSPCTRCQDLACTCALLRPRGGALHHGETAQIYYNVNAPMHEGCVATLIQASCWPAGGAGGGAAGPAALVAYRVVAPRLTARVRPCRGDNVHCYCGVEEGPALLRPRGALVVGRRACCRLALTNTTPLLAAVHFDTPIDGTEFLKIKFIPNDFNVKPYGHVEVRVELQPLQVCARRVFVYRARVLAAPRPLYVLLDAALSGVRVSCEVPLDDDFVVITRTQRRANPNEKTKNPLTTDEIFAEEDRKRALVKENICQCPFETVDLPPAGTPAPPAGLLEEEAEGCSPVLIVEEPPPLRRVCPCERCGRPSARAPPFSSSLQYTNVALNEVHERRITLRNESVVTAQWTTAVRRWPKKHTSGLHTERRARPADAPGVSLWVLPPGGLLGAAACATVVVGVAATCWGLYTDQILIQIDNVEPIVLDVWVEAVGNPLLLKSLPHHQADVLPTLWMSPCSRRTLLAQNVSCSRRTLLAQNVSCSSLVVRAYLARRPACGPAGLPLRLYWRLRAAPAPACCRAPRGHEVGETSDTSLDMQMETGMEVYLAPDCGPQDNTYYRVCPEECTIAAGECMKWDIEMNSLPHPDVVPDVVLLLRLTPTPRYGECWYRPEPPPRLVRLRRAQGEGRLALAADDVTAALCALDLPRDSCLRIRKRFCIQNLGNGTLDVSAKTKSPWCLLQECTEGEGGDSDDTQAVDRKEDINLILPPSSSVELCVEVRVSTREAWPSEDASPSSTDHPPRRRSTTMLYLYDDYHVLKSLPLTLDIEYPVIQMEPTTLDFGFVTDGDSRKSYITVSHTSRTNTLRLMIQWVGSNDFEIWPPSLEVPPGGSSRVYVQYIAVWRRGVSEGSVCVRIHSETGPGPAWCRAQAPVRASATRDQRWRAAPHDYTDQLRPVPPAARGHLACTGDNDFIQ